MITDLGMPCHSPQLADVMKGIEDVPHHDQVAHAGCRDEVVAVVCPIPVMTDLPLGEASLHVDDFILQDMEVGDAIVVVGSLRDFVQEVLEALVAQVLQ